jgi:exopolysaccharide production protein ExoQ
LNPPSLSLGQRQASPASLAAVDSYAASRQNRLSWAVGFFFSFRAATTYICVQVLGTDPRLGAELNVAGSLLLLAAAVFHSFNGNTPAFISLRRLPAVRWTLLFLAFSALSAMWSGTVSLAASIGYWSAMAADVGTVLLLLSTEATLIAGVSLLHGYIFSTCGIALLAWCMPLGADLRIGDIDYFNPNQIANLCAFALLFAQCLTRLNKKALQPDVPRIVFIFLAITLLRTLSKTTLAAFILAQLFLLIQDRSMAIRTKVYLALGSVLAVFIFWGLIEAYYEVYTSSGNQVETLTGRTAIWAFALEHGLEHPWLGNGIDSLWKVMPPLGPDRFEARHAENEFLQQFYAYGIVGVVLLAGLYSSLLRQVARLSKSPLRVAFVSLMLFVLVRGLAEAEPFDLILPLWAVVVVSMLVSRSIAPLQVSVSSGPEIVTRM